MTVKFLNYTPHRIVLNNGDSYPSVGVARVSSTHTEPNEHGIATVRFGEVENLPAPAEGVYYIVSALVRAALPEREDLVAPATGHPDTVRNDRGHIVSVPCFVR